MNILKKTAFGTVAAGVLLAASSSQALADWPERSITLIVPYPAGGTIDIISRTVAEPLSERLGVPIVIDNRGGAGGSVGTTHASRQDADGYTIASANTGTHAINSLTRPDLGYSPTEDFEYIGLVAQTPYVLAVRDDSEFQTVEQVIEAAHDNPGMLTYGTTGAGSATHLAAEMFADLAGIELEHIPYNGSAESSAAMLGGEIDLLFASFPGTISHVYNEEARVLGVGSSDRVPQVPDVPTMQEAGLDGYESVLWIGMAVPAGVPEEIQQRLHEEITDIVQNDEATRQRLVDNGAAPATSDSRDAMTELVHASIEQYRPIVEQIMD